MKTKGNVIPMAVKREHIARPKIDSKPVERRILGPIIIATVVSACIWGALLTVGLVVAKRMGVL